jgi:hypothetical protein
MGEWMYSSTFFDLGTSWRWVVSFTSRPLYSRGKSLRYPLDRKLGRTKIWMCQQIWVKLHNIKFHGNLFSISAAVACGHTDNRTLEANIIQRHISATFLDEQAKKIVCICFTRVYINKGETQKPQNASCWKGRATCPPREVLTRVHSNFRFRNWGRLYDYTIGITHPPEMLQHMHGVAWQKQICWLRGSQALIEKYGLLGCKAQRFCGNVASIFRV